MMVCFRLCGFFVFVFVFCLFLFVFCFVFCVLLLLLLLLEGGCFVFYIPTFSWMFEHDWTHAVLDVLYACVLYFCICTCFSAVEHVSHGKAL